MVLFIIVLFKLIKSKFNCSDYPDCFSCNLNSLYYKYRSSCIWINNECKTKNTSNNSLGIETIFDICSSQYKDNSECGQFEYYDLKNNIVNSSYTKDKYILLNKTASTSFIPTGILNYCSYSYEVEDFYVSEKVEIYFKPSYYADFKGFGYVTYFIDGKEYKEKIIHIRDTIKKVEFNTTMEFEKLRAIKIDIVYDVFYNSFYFKLILKRKNNNKKVIIIIAIVIVSLILIGIFIILIFDIVKKCKESRRHINHNYNIPTNNILTINITERNSERKILVPIDEVLTNPQFLGPQKCQKKYQKYNKDCSICLDKIKSDDIISFTRCSHLFHHKCLISFIKSNYDNNNDNTYKSNCPNCKTDIIHKFYKIK